MQKQKSNIKVLIIKENDDHLQEKGVIDHTVNEDLFIIRFENDHFLKVYQRHEFVVIPTVDPLNVVANCNFNCIYRKTIKRIDFCDIDKIAKITSEFFNCSNFKSRITHRKKKGSDLTPIGAKGLTQIGTDEDSDTFWYH